MISSALHTKPWLLKTIGVMRVKRRVTMRGSDERCFGKWLQGDLKLSYLIVEEVV